MNKKAVWIVAIIVIVLIGLVVFSQNKPEVKSFKPGLISILSGDYASVGENFRNGVILANEDYNKANPDAPIEIVIEDDGFSGGKGLSAYEKLVGTDQIDSLINVSTPTIDSIYTKVVEKGIPVMQVGEQGIEPKDDNVFGLFPDSIESEFQFGVYMRESGVREMAIVYTNMDAMVRFVEAFKKGFQGTTTDFVISADEKDFRTHALKVADSKLKTVGLFIFPEQGAQFVKEYLKIAKNSPQLAFDASLQTGFADYKRILGDTNILNGSILGTFESSTSEEFKQRYKERFNSDFGFLSDVGYDAFNLLVKTYSPDKAEWVNNLKKVSYDGASGKIQFGPTNNRMPMSKIMKIENGEIVSLE